MYQVLVWLGRCKVLTLRVMSGLKSLLRVWCFLSLRFRPVATSWVILFFPSKMTAEKMCIYYRSTRREYLVFRSGSRHLIKSRVRSPVGDRATCMGCHTLLFLCFFVFSAKLGRVCLIDTSLSSVRCLHHVHIYMRTKYCDVVAHTRVQGAQSTFSPCS